MGGDPNYLLTGNCQFAETLIQDHFFLVKWCLSFDLVGGSEVSFTKTHLNLGATLKNSQHTSSGHGRDLETPGPPWIRLYFGH